MILKYTYTRRDRACPCPQSAKVGRAGLAPAEKINGYMILKNAYNEKEQLRFATISVQSPKRI